MVWIKIPKKVRFTDPRVHRSVAPWKSQNKAHSVIMNWYVFPLKYDKYSCFVGNWIKIEMFTWIQHTHKHTTAEIILLFTFLPFQPCISRYLARREGHERGKCGDKSVYSGAKEKTWFVSFPSLCLFSVFSLIWVYMSDGEKKKERKSH